MAATGASGQPPRRILIIKPSSLGDVVHALPVLAGLRRAYPRAHISWLVSRSLAPLLEGHPLLDEVIPFDRHRFGRALRSVAALGAFLRFLRALRERQFDLVIDLQGLVRSGFLALASGARCRIGLAEARELGSLFYSRRVVTTRPQERSTLKPGRNTGIHAVERNLRLGRALGLPVDPADFPLGVRDDELAAARALLTRVAGLSPDSFVGVLPGARWGAKRWPAEHWARLIDRLHAEGFGPVVLLGSTDDRGFAEAIRAGCRAALVDLVGQTTLRELAALLALAALVVCHDSGPMHIAAALARPIVAIFGPTNPARTGPYCTTARVVSGSVECAPCYRRQCPLGHQACLRQLPVEAVLEAVRQVVSSSAGKAVAPWQG